MISTRKEDGTGNAKPTQVMVDQAWLSKHDRLTQDAIVRLMAALEFLRRERTENKLPHDTIILELEQSMAKALESLSRANTPW